MKKPLRVLLTALAAVLGMTLLLHLFDFTPDPALACTQEYIAGTGNIKGEVDKASFERLGKAYAIGANAEGFAVFKDPAVAMKAFKSEYARGIARIQRKNHLLPLMNRTMGAYQDYGWQTNGGTAEEQQQAQFVTSFLDIYENSFHDR